MRSVGVILREIEALSKSPLGDVLKQVGLRALEREMHVLLGVPLPGDAQLEVAPAPLGVLPASAAGSLEVPAGDLQPPRKSR